MHGEIALDVAVAAFLRGGVAAIAATRDAPLRPEITRAWGPELADGRCALRICLTAQSGSRTIANLTANGELAINFTLPTTYRGVQIKGTLRELAPPTPYDIARVERHAAAFVAEAEQVGLPRAIGARFATGPFVAVELAIRELYDQTPGPRAGAAL